MLQFRDIQAPKRFANAVKQQNVMLGLSIKNNLLRAASLYLGEVEALREGERPEDAAKRLLDEIESRPQLMKFLQAIVAKDENTPDLGAIPVDGHNEERIAMALATYLHRKSKVGVEDAVVVDVQPD